MASLSTSIVIKCANTPRRWYGDRSTSQTLSPLRYNLKPQKDVQNIKISNAMSNFQINNYWDPFMFIQLKVCYSLMIDVDKSAHLDATTLQGRDYPGCIGTQPDWTNLTFLDNVFWCKIKRSKWKLNIWYKE